MAFKLITPENLTYVAILLFIVAIIYFAVTINKVVKEQARIKELIKEVKKGNTQAKKQMSAAIKSGSYQSNLLDFLGPVSLFVGAFVLLGVSKFAFKAQSEVTQRVRPFADRFR